MVFSTTTTPTTTKGEPTAPRRADHAGEAERQLEALRKELSGRGES
jgi:hypothetical protein